MEPYQLIAPCLFLISVLYFAEAQVDCPLFTADLLGTTDAPSTTGLVGSALVAVSGDPSMPVSVQVHDSNIVCLRSGQTRDTYSGVSVVVNYTCTGALSECSGNPILSQFEFECVANPVRWAPSVDGSATNIITTPPDASLSTTLRTDCGVCVSPARSVFATITNNEQHCGSCNSACDTTQPSLMRCFNRLDSGCCNFFESDTCVGSCPSPLVPNSNFDCVTSSTIGTGQPSYSVMECEDPQLSFSVMLSGQNSCTVTVSTLDDSATAADDYIELNPPVILQFSATITSLPVNINIVDDLVFEPTERFNISLSTTSDGCLISPGNEIIPVYILDDEDCTGVASMPCDENAMCEELPKRSNFTCTCIPPYVGNGMTCSRGLTVPQERASMGDDPHFSIALPSGKLLCYTVQGEHGFVFNLISNKVFHMNAMFVPDSRREEVTWLGSMGIVVQNSQYKTSNSTSLRFEAKGKEIHIGNTVILQAQNVEKLSFSNGKLTISEAPPFEGFRYPSVLVNLWDVGLNFTIKFLNEHLDLFWHSTGTNTKDSHGLVGQFFQEGVEIDETRKILILPGKEPVPVMRRPVWSFMEREVPDDQLCWTAMNPGYQGEGLIDGTYLDYLVNDVLSMDFTFKKQQ